MSGVFVATNGGASHAVERVAVRAAVERVEVTGEGDVDGGGEGGARWWIGRR